MTDYNYHYLDLITNNNCHWLYLWQIIIVIVYILWQRISVIINLVWQILNVIIYHLWHLLTAIISPTMSLINYQENIFYDSFFRFKCHNCIFSPCFSCLFLLNPYFFCCPAITQTNKITKYYTTHSYGKKRWTL